MRSEPAPRPKPSRRQRYRYILFDVLEPRPAPERADLIRDLQGRAPSSLGAWLTRYEAGRGVLRVNRGQEKAAASFLGGLGAGLRIRTVSTSGTIAALERRHGDQGGRQRRS